MNHSPGGATAPHSESDAATVCVHGIGSLDQYRLELYFESKRVNGGDIADIHINRSEDVANITFKDSAVAQRVLAKQEVVFEGQTLTIERPPKCDTLSILVLGLQPSVTKDTLELYFESKRHSGGGPVKNLLYNEDSNWARITFESEEVCKRVLSKSHNLSGVSLVIRPCPLVTMLQVYDVSDISSQMIELYFENERKSGGGAITSCQIKDGSVAIIKFEKQEVAERVLKKAHKLSQHELKVDIYYPEVGITRVIPPLNKKPPNPFHVSLDHPDMFTFLMQSPEAVKWREAQEAHLKFKLDITKDDELNVGYLSNGLDRRTEDIWQQEVKTEISDYLKRIRVCRIPVSENVLDSVGKQCTKYHSKAVVVNCDKDAKMVVITGFEEDAKTTKAKLKKDIGELESSNAVIENEITLQAAHLKLMILSNHISYMNERVPSLNISTTESAVLLKGRPNDLQRGFSLIFDDFQSNIVQQDLPMSESVYGGLKEKPMLDLVEEKINEEKLLVALEVHHSKSIVTMCAFSDPDIDACKALIGQVLTQKRITFPDEGKKVLESSRWRNMRDELLTTYKGSLILSADPDTGVVDIVCTPAVVTPVNDTVAKLNDLMVQERVVQMALVSVYVIQTYFSNKIRTICDHVNCAIPACTTTITPCDSNQLTGYIVKGSKESSDMAVSELQRLSSQLVHDDISITTVSMPQYMLSSSGRRFLDDLSACHRAAWAIDDNMEHLLDALKKQQPLTVRPRSWAAAAAASSVTDSTTVIKLQNDFRIRICSTDLRKSDVDVIVLPADAKLCHTLRSVRGIVDYGGAEIESACRDSVNMRTRRELPLGTACVTDSGRLRCKRLVHMVMVAGDLMQTDDMLIQEGISTSLDDVKYGDMKSVAFQVLEGGKSEKELLPKAQSIAGALIMYLICGDDHQIREVQLVSQDHLVIQTMTTAVLEVIRNFGIETHGILTGTDADDTQLDGAVGGAVEAGDPDDESVVAAPDSVTLSVYGLEQDDLRMVVKGVQAKCDEMCRSILLSSEAEQQQIADLSTIKFNEMKDLQNKYAPLVRLNIERDDAVKYIEISGRAARVLECREEIFSILENSNTDMTAAYAAGGAVGGAVGGSGDDEYFWEKKPKGGAFEPYSKDISDLLELAYRNDPSKTAEYEDDLDERYIVDFTKMEEMARAPPQETITVRRVKGRYSNEPTDLPHSWDQMKPGERLRCVQLDKASEQYKEVEQDFLSGLSRGTTVHKIERIQNPFLYQQYKVKKKQMDKVNEIGNMNQRKLYHGTSHDTVVQINTNGFNRSYCGKNAVVHGRGVYFAEQPSYSAQLMYSPRHNNGDRFVYQCLVLTGEFTSSDRSYVEPPAKDSHNQAIRYDSVVDFCNNPSIFVIFNDTQAYPEYLITFRN